MTRRFNLLLLLLFSIVLSSYGQDNLYDCGNSKNFAQYLFNTGQYELSRHELERIKFFCTIDTTTQLTLLKSYRKLNLLTNEQEYFDMNGIEKGGSFPVEYHDEYIRLLMTKGEYGKVEELIDKGFKITETVEHKLGAELLLKNWEKAYQLSLHGNPMST